MLSRGLLHGGRVHIATVPVRSLLGRRWRLTPHSDFTAYPTSWLLRLRCTCSHAVYGFRPEAMPAVGRCDDERGAHNETDQSDVRRLIDAYCQHAHKVADFDPLRVACTAPCSRAKMRELRLDTYGLHEHSVVRAASLRGVPAHVNTAAQLVDHLDTVFCGHLSAQFSQLESAEERDWVIERLQSVAEERVCDEERCQLARLLIHSQTIDRFLAAKFGSVKRYSGEGAESMLVLFRTLFLLAAQASLDEIVIGMAHRGRLNLLLALLHYPAVQLMQKMSGMSEFPAGYEFASGDVLSHISQSKSLEFDSSQLLVTLMANPSHLEAVNPMVMGHVRARQQSLLDGDYSHQSTDTVGSKVLCVQVHGDAAVSGQGVIQESLTLSQVPHCRVGGSVHVVINNQLGFTANRWRARSSRYCTDVALSVAAPVFRVNGDHPHAVVRACKLAFEYRQRFRRDVFVDLVCFRRWGHNELDDPSLTNPLMYNNINHRVTVPDSYVSSVVQDGLMTSQQAEHVQRDIYHDLGQQLKLIESHVPRVTLLPGGRGRGVTEAPAAVTVWDTGVHLDLLQYLAAMSVHCPDHFNLHPNLVKVLQQQRLSRMTEGKCLDWALCETLAFASLLAQGYSVRLCGQDVGRGTFSQRHVMLVDQENEQCIVPLNSLLPSQTAHLEVVNSALTEEAQLAFEYGMSVQCADRLCVWEAQFGDFFNGAQIAIDTMISSGHVKWLYESGLVLLLPHGMDGAGPEHSSCRLERFLQLTDSSPVCVDGDNVNLHVIQPSTPAQYFHALRRQMVRNFRRPLVVATTKLLLRSARAVSASSELVPGSYFHTVLDDIEPASRRAKTVLFCSGKHYYQLLEQRRSEMHGSRTALVRVEQLAPFPVDQLLAIVRHYSSAKRFIWCQEEHMNQGAWSFVQPRFRQLVGIDLEYCGRAVSASTATGIGSVHKAEALHVTRAPFL